MSPWLKELQLPVSFSLFPGRVGAERETGRDLVAVGVFAHTSEWVCCARTHVCVFCACVRWGGL